MAHGQTGLLTPKAKFFWLRGAQKWRIRTDGTPCSFETQFLNTVEHWGDDETSTLYKEFRRTFRVPFPVFEGILQDAYASGAIILCPSCASHCVVV